MRIEPVPKKGQARWMPQNRQTERQRQVGKQSERKWRRHVLRFVVSGVIGVLVFGVCVLAAWRALGGSFYSNSAMQSQSISLLRHYAVEMQRDLEEGKPLPKTWSDLDASVHERGSGSLKVNLNRDGAPLDRWGNPLLYETDVTSFALTCFGRDGWPGGKGFDTDIVYRKGAQYIERDSPVGEESSQYGERPSLRAFLFRLPTAGVFQVAAMSGVLAFLTAWVALGSTKLDRRKLRRALIQIAVVSAVSIFIALILAQVHIPSTH